MATSRARPTNKHQQRFRLSYDFASVTTTTTDVIYKAKIKGIQVDRCLLILPAGLAANVSNFVTAALVKNGSTVVASWSTSTVGQGTITAQTPVEMVLSGTLANLFVADGDVLDLLLTVTGTVTVPLGRIVVEGSEL